VREAPGADPLTSGAGKLRFLGLGIVILSLPGARCASKAVGCDEDRQHWINTFLLVWDLNKLKIKEERKERRSVLRVGGSKLSLGNTKPSSPLSNSKETFPTCDLG